LRLFEKAYDSSKNGIANIEAIGWAYADYFKKYPNYFKATCYHQTVDSQLHNEDLYHGQILGLGVKINNIVSKCLIDGIEDGTIKKDINPIETTLVLWGQTMGVLQTIMTKCEIIHAGYQINPEVLIKAHFDMCTRALKA